MPDDRLEGVNLLNPEVSPAETEAGFESKEAMPELASRKDETPRVDKEHLSRVKATIPAQVQAVTEVAKDPFLAQIENILSENIGEIYLQLPEDKREAFKLKGEEIASKIQIMVKGAKIKVHQILNLVSDWLQMIPGVNVYFLRQEAKIKLDKIMDYVEEQSKNSVNNV